MDDKQELDMRGILQLSDDLGAKHDPKDASVTLYELVGYSPTKKLFLTGPEMGALYTAWSDGCCPVCLAEIPLNDIICDYCLDKAKGPRR